MVSPAVTGVQAETIEHRCGERLQSGPWGYSPSSDRYVDSGALSPVRGYWVKMGAMCELEVTGEKADRSLQLSPGWNMLSSTETFTVSDIKSVCGSSSLEGTIWYWPPSSEGYVAVESVEPGKGYWVKMESSCSFDPERADIPGTPEEGEPREPASTEPSFELVSVETAGSATIRVNGQLRSVVEDMYVTNLASVNYVYVEDIIQTDAAGSRGTVVLTYSQGEGERTATVSNQEEPEDGDQQQQEGDVGEGWSFTSWEIQGKTDSVETSRQQEEIVIDTGNTGYCGGAFFEKTLTTGTRKMVSIVYSVEADRYSGKTGVWLDGKFIRGLNPVGESARDSSGTWMFSVQEGSHTISVGIEDTSQRWCNMDDHASRLVVEEVRIADADQGGIADDP